MVGLPLSARQLLTEPLLWEVPKRSFRPAIIAAIVAGTRSSSPVRSPDRQTSPHAKAPARSGGRCSEIPGLLFP